MEFAHLVVVGVIVRYVWVLQWVCSTNFPCCCELVFDLRQLKFKSIFLMKLLSLWLFYVSVCTYMWCCNLWYFSVALFKQEDGGWTGNSFPLDFKCSSRSALLYFYAESPLPIVKNILVSVYAEMELGIQFWVQFLKKMNSGFVLKIRPHSSLLLTKLDWNWLLTTN